MRLLVNQPLKPFSLSQLSQQTGLKAEELIQNIIELQQEGLKIQPYRINEYFYEPVDHRLHPDVIAGHLNTRWWGRKIYCFEQTSSTIDIAKKRIGKPDLHGTLIVADYQSGGRGRQGNRWNAPKGKDLLITFLLQMGEWEATPALLSLYAVTAAARVLDTAYDIPVSIKWPNDLLSQGKKLGGVLVEKDSHQRVVLISMGLNVHSQPKDWPEENRKTSISLSMIRKEDWQRDLLLAQCGTTWETLWETSMQDFGETIRGYWKRYSITLDKNVSLYRNGKEIQGVTRGIDELGRLRFIAEDGNQYHLLVEEVQKLRVLE